MADFFSDYGLFLLKTVTSVVALIYVVGVVLRALGRSPGADEGHLTVKRLNDAFRDLADAIRAQTMPRSAIKRLLKERKRSARHRGTVREGEAARPRAFVLDFEGDLRATAVDALRREVSAILQVASEGDEVLLRLTSAGGAVYGYGLAAAQLERLRAAGLGLTATIDKVAASGGYMMAVVADHVVAAPFAVVGSIGVVGAVPNVRRLLARHDVDVEYHTAGAYKRTLTVVGENTEEGRRKFQEQLEETHALFQELVARHRPDLDLARVATGEHWYGEQARALGLVDEVATSDEVLMRRLPDADLLHVAWEQKRPLTARLGAQVEAGLVRALERAWERVRMTLLP